MVDLNKFKEINDTYGHFVGDSVLVYIATKLKELCPNVVRFGGDEFLMLFDSSLSKATIQKSLNNLLAKLEGISFKVGQESFKTSFSFGVAQYEKEALLQQVLESADKEMYTHKKSMRH
jgi:diguanylate cyclase (GGDEF)-like protein